MTESGWRRMAQVLAPLALACTGTSAQAASSDRALALLPWPQSVERGAGTLTMPEGATIGFPAEDVGAAIAARILAAQVKSDRGLTLSPQAGEGLIRFIRDGSIQGDEAYRLTVTSQGAEIAASSAHGMLYGAMTLAQLISPDTRKGTPVTLPAVTINDAPRFAWRGLMVDVARHFQPIDSLYRIVDDMVQVKLNTLHLHLSDDQGWRFEVKKYPLLTQNGGWRTPPSTGGPAEGKIGGFYTQAELKALVAYAGERGITIVPEIDLPGHAQALVAAYPEFGVFGDRPPVSHDWGINPWLLNPGPRGVAFVKDVLDELMEVFPSTFIHLGGDEAVKDQWQRSPEVQAQIRQLGLKDENALQSWLVDQFGSYLEVHGRRLIGWDEILEGGLPASASVMSWRGEQGAIDAANQNHDVVLSPGGPLYFDNLQTSLPDESIGRLGGEHQTLEKVYDYDPMPSGIAADKAGHVLGAQANAWSEYLNTPWHVSHALFPRAGALAEITWTTRGSTRDFGEFLTRLVPQIDRWRESGAEVSDGAFAVAFTALQARGEAITAKRVKVALSTQTSFGIIRYTLDGSTPTARSPAYRNPLAVKPGVTIRAASFDASGDALGTPRVFDTSRAAMMKTGNSALVACPHGALGLRVPLTADAAARSPGYNVNLFDMCNADQSAPLGVARKVTVGVVRLARNYGLAHEADKVAHPYPVTAFGELVISADCIAAEKNKNITPTVLMTFPLPDPATSPQRFDFFGSLPDLPALRGDHDVCFRFTAPADGPYYTVGDVTYEPAGK